MACPLWVCLVAIFLVDWPLLPWDFERTILVIRDIAFGVPGLGVLSRLVPDLWACHPRLNDLSLTVSFCITHFCVNPPSSPIARQQIAIPCYLIYIINWNDEDIGRTVLALGIVYTISWCTEINENIQISLI